MRPAISWSDLRGQRVAVWGLGTEGRANVRKLRSIGVEPVLVDDAPSHDGSELVLRTDGEGMDAMLASDAVVKTPGISRRRAEVTSLEAVGVPVLGGLGLWLQEADRSRVLCVTGTKGKSTTTAVAAHLAEGLGLRVFAGGNLGSPPFDPDAPADVDLWVIETSSYQATDLAVTPPVVAATSLSPDHVPWHRTIDDYFAEKLSMCHQPGAVLTVASAESPELVERASLLGPEVRWIDSATFPSVWSEPLGLRGTHNRVNVGIARACLAAMGVNGADDEERLLRASAGFEGLASRLQTVGWVDGVEFVDDGLSTNVLPTVAAVDSFGGRRVALIAGGLDRDIDYRPLAVALSRHGAPVLVLTVYSTGPKIQAAIDELGSSMVEARPMADLGAAVRDAYKWAKPDGVVLLSPAAASFDAFRDYRHRSERFREAVSDL